MTFAQPAWLWLLPVALPLVLLLHARRRRDVVVPSLVVWRMVQTSTAPVASKRSFPWREPLLWLQLLAVALLVVALARPVVGGAPDTHWIVLVDASLAMTSTDVEPSRFDAARRTVSETWGGRAAQGRVSLVSVGPVARLLADGWPAGPGLDDALAGVYPSAGPADWQGAAARAASLDRGERSRVVVVTDAFGAANALAALEAAAFAPSEVDFVSVGTALINVGVGDVAAEPRGDRPDQWTVEGRVVTAGFSRGDVVRVVASYRSPGSDTFLPWGAAEVVLDGGGTGDFAIPLDLPGPGEVQVRGPAGDHVPQDDAWTLSLRDDPVRVGIVGEPLPALLRALASIGGLEVYASESVPDPAEAALFDLLILTGGPAEAPATSVLWLGALPDGSASGAPRPLPAGAMAASAHPLVADVDAAALAVSEATPLSVPAGATVLLRAGDEAFAWARTTTAGRQVMVGFDLEASNWTAQVSFPAFVAALVDWAAPRGWSHVSGGCRVGERCEWPRAAFAGGWRLLDPEGEPLMGLPAPTPVAEDPLAQAVWEGPVLDAGFEPKAAGTYTLVSPSGAVSLPVVADPLGDQDPRTMIDVAESPTRSSAPAAWRWLAALGGLILLCEGAWGLSRQRRVLRRRWRAPLALAAAALVALALGVLGVPLPSYEAGEAVVWVGREGPPAAAAGPGRAWQWARIGGPEVEAGPTAARDLPSALERALAVQRSPDDLRIVVSTRESELLTIGEAARLSEAAQTAGARIDVVRDGAAATGPSRPTTPVLGSVSLPERVRAGSRFVIAVDVLAPAGTGWLLEAELTAGRAEGASEPTPSTEEAGAGDGRVELELQAGAEGEHVYRLALSTEGVADTATAESVTVVVGPPPAVLLVALDDARGAGLAAALETQGVGVERATPFRMPGDIERLGRFDAVLLVDVAANDMFPEYQALLERYVRELGGGLAIVGGTSAFGAGGYYATPLEEVSPLSSRITDEAPEVALAFVLDRSGSMSGPVASSTRMDVAKAATLEAVGLLGERSLAAVIAFDTEARVVLPLTPVADDAAFRDALASVTPAGGTSIYPGLVAAHGLMSASDSATRHVVVLTDGLSQEGDFAGILRDLAESEVTTSFVGVGDAADRRQLATLAALSGGAFHMALDFRSLPSLLAQEALSLAATPIEEGRVFPTWAEGGAPDFLRDFGSSALPALGGYVRTTAKDEASVHAYARGDDPLLASWRYGLGRVVAFTSDGDGPWSEAWLASGSFGPLWAQAIRWAAERPVRDPWGLRLGRRGDVLDVVVDVPGEASSAAAASLPVVTLAGPEGEELGRRRLEWVGPARAAASFTLATEAPMALEVVLEPAAELGLASGASRTVAWPLPPATALRSDLVPVASLAEASGGEVYEAAADLEMAPADRSLRWRALPQAWLLLGLLTFLASLALRYGVSLRISRPLTARRAARTRTA